MTLRELFPTAAFERNQIIFADHSLIVQAAKAEWWCYPPPALGGGRCGPFKGVNDAALVLTARGCGPAADRQFTQEDLRRSSHARAKSKSR